MIVPVIESGGEGYNKKLCYLLNRVHNLEYNNVNYDLGLINYNQYIKKYNQLIDNESIDNIYNEIIKTLFLQNNVDPNNNSEELPFILRFNYSTIQSIKNFNKYNIRKYNKKKKKWNNMINKYLNFNEDINQIITNFLI